MFKRLSSLILISFLTFLVGAKDLSLGFCMCEETLFMGKDPCSKVVEYSPCCQECVKEEEPCDDCVVPLKLEVEDYLWSSSSYLFQAPPLEEIETTFATLPVVFPPSKTLHLFIFEPPPPPGRDLLIQQRRLLL